MLATSNKRKDITYYCNNKNDNKFFVIKQFKGGGT